MGGIVPGLVKKNKLGRKKTDKNKPFEEEYLLKIKINKMLEGKSKIWNYNDTTL